jgi:hypothetical protein
MKTILYFFVILMSSTTAWATGGTFCKADSNDIGITVDLTNAQHFGNPLLLDSSQVSLNLKDPTISNEIDQLGIRNYKFDISNDSTFGVVQWFNVENRLNLAIHNEIEKTVDGKSLDVPVIIELVIIASRKNDSDGIYKGTYKVSVESSAAVARKFKKIYSGKITCEI